PLRAAWHLGRSGKGVRSPRLVWGPFGGLLGAFWGPFRAPVEQMHSEEGEVRSESTRPARAGYAWGANRPPGFLGPFGAISSLAGLFDRARDLGSLIGLLDFAGLGAGRELEGF